MDRIFLGRPAPGLPELPAGLQPYAEAIAAYLRQPTAWFVPLNQLATGVAQSKIGGWPYLPQGAPSPLLDAAGRHHYNLLVQLNLAEVPAPRPEFVPAAGLLQVFAPNTEDVLDSDADSFRLCYYPTVATNPADLVTDFSAFDLASIDGYAGVPPEGLALAWQSLTDNRVEPGEHAADLDYLFTDLPNEERSRLLLQLEEYVEAHNATLPEDGSRWEPQVPAQYGPADASNAFQSPLAYGGFSIPDHQLGGIISQFWQGDPRQEWDDAPNRPHHERLLLAYDARGNCTEWAVPFLGHDAKLLFFLNREALACADFSDVLFEYMA